MLDVVLYRINDDGMIDLRERSFQTIQRLARFFASDRGDRWDWAEIVGRCQCQAIRYSADELRAMANQATPTPVNALSGAIGRP